MKSFAVALALLAFGCGGDGPVASPTSTTGQLEEAGSFDATSPADASTPDALTGDAARDAGTD